MTTRGRFIALSNGKRWYLEDPRVEDFDLEAAAFGLAHISRFTGQAGPYTVLTHQCHVADICVHYGRPEFELEALTHDTHEFASGDVSSPVKAVLRAMGSDVYDRFEAQQAAPVRAWFGLPAATSDYVRRADLMACHDEGRVFCPDTFWTGPFSGLSLVCEEPVEAMERWLARVRLAMRAQERRTA